jgi:hypothetical protein
MNREALAMTPLERLFRHEVEFHRRLREAAEERGNAAATHTSFALQHGYEGLMRAAAGTTAHQVETMKERLALAGDPRDVLAARDSVNELLGVPGL